jgi:putative ABC transport system permease protein
VRALWLRAPFMWLRFPVGALAVLFVAAITAMTAVTSTAFLASTEQGSLREGIEPNRWVAGYRIGFPNYLSSELLRRGIEFYEGFLNDATEFLDERFADLPYVGKAHLNIVGTPMVAAHGNENVNLRPVVRTDAVRHVTRLEGTGTGGAWLSDGAASELRVGPGDEIDLILNSRRATLEIAGTYKHLAGEPPRVFWSSLAPYVYRDPGQEYDPPPLLLMDLPTYRSVLPQLRDVGGISVDVPLVETEMSLAEAERIASTFESTLAAVRSTGPLSGETSPFFFRAADSSTSMYGIVASARERLTTVTPVTEVLSAGARVVALALMAAAGFFLVKRRRTEVAVLAARGIGPMAQASRLGLESLIPLVIGGAIGAIGGFLLVEVLGPARDISFGLLTDALPEVAVTVGMGFILLVLTAAMAVRREERAIAELPASVTATHWLVGGVAIAAATGVIAWRMTQNITGADADSLEDPSITAAPVLMILGIGFLAAGLFRFALPLVARALRFRIPPLYLSARRLSGASMLTQVLVIAGVWSLGIAIYAFTVSASIDATADAKSKLFIGSDFSALVTDARTVDTVDYTPATGVVNVERMPVNEGSDVSILGVDPATFADAAFWDSSFADTDLHELIDLIQGPAAVPLKVIATADFGPEPSFESPSGTVPLEVVAIVDSFPGQPSNKDMLVMSRDSLAYAQAEMGASSGAARPQIWAKGDRAEIEAALSSSGFSYYQALDSETVLETPGLQSLLWMLGLLAALGGAAALIAVFGLLLYLQARQRAALVSSALTRRMGMSRRAEFVTWSGEVAGALFTSLLTATVIGVQVSDLMKDRLDPRPELLPQPILVVPVALLLALFAGMLVLSVVSGWRIRSAIDRADVAEVMRT